jgi:hypothetical protein
MRMFEDMQITKMVIHEVYQRAVGGPPVPPNFSTSLSVLPADGMDVFKGRVVDVMGKPGKSAELSIRLSGAGSAAAIARSLLAANDTQFISRSRAIASLLSEVQTNRTMPGGILVIFAGRAGRPARRFVGYLKAEPHQGFRRRRRGGEMTLEFLGEILLSQASRFYKIGMFVAPAGDDDDFPNEWNAFVYDDQISGNARESASRYFFEAFLGCDFPANAAHQLRQFYLHTRDYIRSLELEEDEKVGLHNALVSYVKVDQAQTVQVAEFGNRYIGRPDLRDAYTAFMRERNVPLGVLPKDLSELRTELKFRRIKFGHQLTFSGPAEQFDSLVTVETIPAEDGDEIQRSWTRITVKDTIQSQD